VCQRLCCMHMLTWLDKLFHDVRFVHRDIHYLRKLPCRQLLRRGRCAGRRVLCVRGLRWYRHYRICLVSARIHFLGHVYGPYRNNA
jgi:hypothetical protein